MNRSHLSLVAAVLAVPAVLVAGCTSSSSSTSAAKSSSGSTAPAGHSASATPTTKAAAIYQGKLPAAKAIGNTVAKRKAVTLAGCTAMPGGWKATGTARNTGAKTASYTITIFFTTSKATVQSYASTKVQVAPGASKAWSAAGKFPAAKGTLCVLRGVA